MNQNEALQKRIKLTHVALKAYSRTCNKAWKELELAWDTPTWVTAWIAYTRICNDAWAKYERIRDTENNHVILLLPEPR